MPTGDSKYSYNFIDLFAGAGGLSEGFLQAGFKPVAHVEMDEFASRTLETRNAYYYLKSTNNLKIYREYILDRMTRDEFMKQIPASIIKTVINKTMSDETLPTIFKTIDGIDFFTEPENTRSNYWLNAVILKDRDAQQDFLQYTNDNGVMTRPIWELMNRLPMFEKCENDGLKNTIWFADRVVNIPSSVRPSDCI